IIAYIILELYTRKKRQKYGFTVLSNSMFIAKLIGMSIVIAAVFSIMVLYRGIPYAVLLLLVVVIIFTIISNKTAFGRYVYAIGGNREAARLSGIDIRKTNMMIFVLMGLLSTIAGIVYTSRLNAAIVAAGQNFEMDCIAAAIIGGTSTLGGEGTIPGAIIGALVMASLDNGMSLMNLGSFEQYLVKGLVLLIAVWFDIATRKKAA
ncbi:MAG: ABC-type transporter, integral rane subunit, partial [Defluviitaleaceae bacterium]|nr:ABC-type transporter, integral rane subunit [Defluviitaleaceae bacterium]